MTKSYTISNRNFGKINSGSTSTNTITVTNTGDEQFQIDSLEVQDIEGVGGFIAEQPSTPIDVKQPFPPNSTMYIDIYGNICNHKGVYYTTNQRAGSIGYTNETGQLTVDVQTGQIWQPLKTTISGIVSCIKAYNDTIYIGGSISNIGGQSINMAAYWYADSKQWEPLISGSFTGGTSVNAILENPNTGDVIIAGKFDNIEGIPANNIAVRRFGSWFALGNGLTGTGAYVKDIVLDAAGNLYVCGMFETAGSTACNNIAMWDGITWSTINGSMASEVDTYGNSLFYDGSNIYVGGRFSEIGGQTISNIAVWDGVNWSAISAETFNEEIKDVIKDSHGNLIVCGAFSQIGTSDFNMIALWNGTNWSNMNANFETQCYCMQLLNNGNVIVCGEFSTYLSGFDHIAQWNGNEFQIFGDNLTLDGVPYCITLSENNHVYLGGSFNNVNYSKIITWCTYYERWVGVNGNSLGGISNAALNIIQVNNGFIFRGYFDRVAGVDCTNGIVRWYNGTWYSLNTSFDSSNPAMAYDSVNDILYVVESHDDTNQIMQYNFGTSTWSLFDTWLGNIKDMLFHNGMLYVIEGTNIYRWDGADYDTLGTGANDEITKIAVDTVNNTIIIGGLFTEINSVPANRIAVWNGVVWSALGDGLPIEPTAIYKDNNLESEINIYVGTVSSLPAHPPRVYRWNGSAWSILFDCEDDVLFSSFAQIDQAFKLYVSDQYAQTLYRCNDDENGIWSDDLINVIAGDTEQYASGICKLLFKNNTTSGTMFAACSTGIYIWSR